MSNQQQLRQKEYYISEAMLYIAMIRLMLARLAKKHQAQQQQPSQDCKTHSTLAA
jgi:hypothetical protein